jgi:hypothetical protein
MLKFNCLITGDDYNLLKTETPESRKKVSALVSMIFIPVTVWFAIGFMLVSNVLQGSTFNAVVVAITMSSLIFLIEKNIIMAHNSRSIKIFRYSLGAVIALLGAICIDEVAFKDDIDQKLFLMNKETINQNLNLIDNNYRVQLNKSQSDVDEKSISWQQALNDAKKEADGSGGSGIKGVHAITKIKLATADALKQDYDNSLSALKVFKEKIALEKAETEKDIKSSFKDGALLLRIKALFHLVFSDVFMAIIYLLFTALFFAMEFLVVFMKSAWPQTNYERRIELIEELGRKRMEKIRNNDLAHFDHARVYPAYKNASKILQQSSTGSIYN